MVSAMSASGILIQHLLILSHKNMMQTLMKGVSPGSIGRCYPSEWIQANLFTGWFNHFICKTYPTETSPYNLDIFTAARAKYVTIISLPPH
ncbi:hypothetical protein GWI33_003039 [Rhynchophorus ferrugineus]|uniref:Uncharacterized protein n=1 Tax=Rhynchophorus ferrugineus TaxID=354439 RepID=A0A834MHC3_RHYFE|nr:hypothetical protein GWI33_003039 [Rhynchophorus ferrugineus]